MTFRDVELVFPIHIWDNLQYLLVRNYLANLKIITTTVLSEFLPRLLYSFLIIYFLLILSFEKHGCQGEGSWYFICIYRKRVKNRLVRDYWANLKTIRPQCSVVDPLPRLLKFI